MTRAASSVDMDQQLRSALRDLYAWAFDLCRKRGPGGYSKQVVVRGPSGPRDPSEEKATRRALVNDLAALAVDLAAEGKL